MDAIDRVANVLLGSRGNTYCDACLASNLTLDSRQEGQQVISALADSAPRRLQAERKARGIDC